MPKISIEDTEIKYPKLDEYIKKYQDPKECDKLMKIEDELNNVQQTLHKTMGEVFFSNFCRKTN